MTTDNDLREAVARDICRSTCTVDCPCIQAVDDCFTLADRIIRLVVERCARCGDAWDDPQTLLLAAGEMTPQELRTARAVVRGIAARIRALAPKEPAP